jgi:arylsulfatase
MGALAGAFPQPGAAQKPDRPNIILCMSDDQGWGDTGYNGHPYLKTPNLDAMSHTGIRFDRFYAGAPVCSPTRGSALTGRHPFRYGIYFANTGHMKKQEVTLAEALKTQGYRTGHFGKWHLGTLSPKYSGKTNRQPAKHYSPPGQNGFDDWFSTEFAVPTWNPYTETDNGQVRDPRTLYWHNGRNITDWKAEGLEGCDSRIIMDKALPFIRDAARQQQPFLTVIWFHAPHAPVVGGPEYRAMYSKFSDDEKHFYGCVTAMDEQVGRLRKELRDLEIDGDTMLWFCADNGPEGKTPYTNRYRGSAGALRGRKRSLFEGGVRVPGMLEWPGRVKPEQSTSVPCSTSDYFPTVLDALGFQMQGRPEPVDGVSLMPLIEGRMKERPRPIGFETTDGAERGAANRLGSPNLTLIDNRYKFLSYLDDERRDQDMLFDLAADPGERFNITTEQPQMARTMKQTLTDWRASCRKSDNGEDY